MLFPLFFILIFFEYVFVYFSFFFFISLPGYAAVGLEEEDESSSTKLHIFFPRRTRQKLRSFASSLCVVFRSFAVVEGRASLRECDALASLA